MSRKNEDHSDSNDFTDASMVDQKLFEKLETVSENFLVLLEQALRKNVAFFFQAKPNAL